MEINLFTEYNIGKKIFNENLYVNIIFEYNQYTQINVCFVVQDYLNFHFFETL